MKTDDVAASLAVISLFLCVFAITNWPDSDARDESFLGISSILWIYAGAFIGTLGFTVLLSSFIMLCQGFSWPRLGLVTTGACIITTGLYTLLKWQAMELPEGGW